MGELSAISGRLAAIFADITSSCEPAGFLRLVQTSQQFISAVDALGDIQDEGEFHLAFSRFIGLQLRFHAAFQQSYDMGLLGHIDESSSASCAPQELKELDRALTTSHRRVELIAVVCRFAETLAWRVGIHKFPNLLLPWGQMFALVLDRPILAAVVGKVDFDKWDHLRNQAENRGRAIFEACNYEKIDILGSVNRIVEEAGRLWLHALAGGTDAGELIACANHLRRLVSFLTLPTQERWIIQGFHTIGPTDSAEAIFSEVLRYDPRPLIASDPLLPQLQEAGFTAPVSGIPLLSIAVGGVFRKRRYVVDCPSLAFFVSRLSAVAIEQVTADPVSFLRSHYRQIPDSLAVQTHQQYLTRVESYIRDATFKETIGEFAADLSGEVSTMLIAHVLGASPEISALIGASFGATVHVIKKIRTI